MAQISRITVSKSFYDICLRELPLLKGHKTYCRMFAYVCFGSFREQGTRRLLLSWDVLAQIEEKEHLLHHRNYNAQEFLTSFQHDVLPGFTWSAYNHRKGKARVMLTDGLPPVIRHALYEELCNLHHNTGRVYFEDGKQYSKAKERSERKRIQTMSSFLLAHTKESQRVLQYMNALPSNLFTRIVAQNYADALAKAQELYIYDNEEKFLHNARVLHRVLHQVQPFYQPSEHSDRIFPFNESMLMLSKEVRQALTRGWIEFDLRSAHLAINAHLWDAPIVNAFLATGESIWFALIQDTYGMMMNDELKSFFKEALYSICYGKHVRAIKEDFHDMMLSADLFLSHPVIKDLLTARDRFLMQVQQDGGYRSHFDVWFSTKEYDHTSILALAAQSLELALLLPALDLAERHDEITLTLWQHDGFTAHIKPGEVDYWVQKICDAVNLKAAAFHVNTRLEVMYL